jgi:DNA helicase HerA-like ATPase
MVEQCLLRGVPVVLVDRKGDFSAYADPDAWLAVQMPDGAHLQGQIAVSLFTPGKAAGRPLALRLLPPDYPGLDEEDRSEASRSAAEALGQMLGMKDTPTDRERREVLRQAIDQIGRHIKNPLDLASLIDGLASDHQGLFERLIRLDPRSRHRQRLIPMLEQLRLSRGYLFSDGDQLDLAKIIQPAVRARTRLAVVSLAFLPDLGDQQFFVSRLLAEARRFCRVNPSRSLQALLVLDEADVFMPATSKPATKEPLLDLLRRARSGGLGVVIGTQSPGDLDYKGRDNITTWALGRIQDNTALDKIKFVAEGTTLDIRAILPGFTAGRFLLRSEGLGVCEVKAHRSLIETTQVPEEKIVELAADCRRAEALPQG